jgi:multidrug efflux pump
MNTFIEACLSRGRTVVLILILVLATGTVSYRTIPKEAQPDVTIPLIYVSLHHEGISPEDAERMLVRPMEKELRGIDGLREMRATAYEGGANMILEFSAGMDITPALNDVRERVDIAKAELPEETDEPRVSEINLALMPVIVVSLSGNIPERQLLREARQLRDDLESITQVLEVEIGGDREEVVEVVINPDIFDTYGLNLGEISAATRNNNVLIAAGNLDSGFGRIPVKVPGLFETPADLLDIPVKTVGDTVLRTRDIATLLPTFKDPMGYSRLNGKPSLTLYVKKRVGENVIDTVQKVRETVAESQQNWPEGMEVAFSQDQSRYIEDMLSDLQNNVISAILLVMIVIVGALGWRSGLLVGIAIPGSFLAGMLVLNILGLTINIIVLFSLILSVGMLVDGAIVVVELADRKMNEGLPRQKAYLIAAQRMALPISASTATTLAAFMPLLFWPGVVGEFMKYLPITLIGTLSASLLMALVFVPTIGSFFGKPGPASAQTMKSLAASEGGSLHDLHGITSFYVRFLEVMLNHAGKVLLLAILLFVGVHFLYGKFGRGVEFFPEVDPDFASILVRMRGNLSIDEMDAQVRKVEEQILKVEGIKAVNARSGISFQGDGITEDTHGLIQLEFMDWDKRRPAREILREISLRTEGVHGIEIHPGEDSPNGPVIRLEISTRYPMAAGRIQRSLNGVADRARLVDSGIRSDIRDGSALHAEDGFVVGGRLRLFALRESPPDRQRLDRVLSRLNNGGSDEWRLLNGGAVEDGRLEVEWRTQRRQRLDQDYRMLEAAAKRFERVADVLGTEIHIDENLFPSHAGGRLIGIVELDTGGAVHWDELHHQMAGYLRGVPGVILEQQVMEAGPPTGKDIQVELSSHNPQLLESAVDRVRAFMETVEGLKDVDDTRPVPAVEWQILVDRAQASRFGADIALVGSYVQFVTNGLLLGTYRPDGADDEVDIRARFPRDSRYLQRIENLRVQTETGSIPIGNFIQRRPAQMVGSIDRIDGRRVLSVTANVDDMYLTDSKVQELRQWQSGFTIPEGLHIRFRGEDEEQRESMAFLGKAFLVALFIMMIILVTQFNSFFHAFLVLTAVVFSTIGVFLGLLLTDQPFGVVMNGIGVIALAGIVVNNNIVLIDTFALQRTLSPSVPDAILRTCAQRFRPVMLTTITTVLGLMPMVLKLNIDFASREMNFNSPSTQWWVQLSTSVAFGLMFATFLTLVLTPSLLMLGHRVHERWAKRSFG